MFWQLHMEDLCNQSIEHGIGLRLLEATEQGWKASQTAVYPAALQSPVQEFGELERKIEQINKNIDRIFAISNTFFPLFAGRNGPPPSSAAGPIKGCDKATASTKASLPIPQIFRKDIQAKRSLTTCSWSYYRQSRLRRWDSRIPFISILSLISL